MQLCTAPPRVSVMPVPISLNRTGLAVDLVITLVLRVFLKIVGKTLLECVAIKSTSNLELKKTLCMYLPSC